MEPDFFIHLDEFSCCVCLEILQDPVTTACGHNFCKMCIEGFWDVNASCSCPQCRKNFSPRPDLQINILLAEVIKKSKHQQLIEAQNVLRSGDVACDVCTKKKLRAIKFCLTCLAFYCETHLQPHRQCEVLKKHKVVEPAGHVQQRLCAEHNTMVELYCRTDKKCVCLRCAAEQHRNHELVEMETERKAKQMQLRDILKMIENKLQMREEKLIETRTTVQYLKDSDLDYEAFSEKELREHEEAITSLYESLTRLKSEITEVITDYKKREVRKSEELIERLEEEIEMLKRTDREMAELLQIDDQVQFLQKCPSLFVLPQDEDLMNFDINKDLFPETLKKNISKLKRFLQGTSCLEFVKTTETENEAPDYILQNLMIRNVLLKYSCQLTLDPNTSHGNLDLSEGYRKVMWKGNIDYPDHADRFECWPQVLCREALSGTRYYWEVEWSGDWAMIAVTYKRIMRKEEDHESLLGGNDNSWCLFCSNSCYSVCHNKKKMEITVPPSSRIGVYLDYPAGSLSFYSILDTVSLLHRFKSRFTEPLYPGFGAEGTITLLEVSQPY